MICLSSVLVAFFCLGAGSRRLEQQTFLSKHDANIAMLPDPQKSIGIGFDLTASYGIAAVSYLNGTTIPIARINGSPEYHEVLSRLSLSSSAHLAPPYSSYDEQDRDKPRQDARDARKAIGLPASDDVAVLSTMISSLVSATSPHLPDPVTAAACTLPHLIALYPEDILDSFLYLNLTYLTLPVRYGLTHHTTTAYSGYGFGLCSSYTDLPSCKKEQQAMDDDVVMTVLYTQTVLTVTLSVMKSAWYLWEPPYRHIEDFELGAKAKQDNPNEEYYWAAVRDRLREIMVKNQHYPRPSKVLMMGESVGGGSGAGGGGQNNRGGKGEGKFLELLREILENLMGKRKVPEIFMEGSESVSAKGAAEMAKRVAWDPYKFVGVGEELGLGEELGSLDALDGENERRDGVC